MADTNSKSHLPYAIRYMARLQEQAAQAGPSHGVPAERLQKCADHLRTTAQSISQSDQGLSEPAAVTMTQKLKLLNFLRQQAL